MTITHTSLIHKAKNKNRIILNQMSRLEHFNTQPDHSPTTQDTGDGCISELDKISIAIRSGDISGGFIGGHWEWDTDNAFIEGVSGSTRFIIGHVSDILRLSQKDEEMFNMPDGCSFFPDYSLPSYLVHCKSCESVIPTRLAKYCKSCQAPICDSCGFENYGNCLEHYDEDTTRTQ